MDQNDFINVIRRLIVEARRAELAGKIDDARVAAGYDDVGEFIRSLFDRPKIVTIPPTKRFFLDPFFDEAYECVKQRDFVYTMDSAMFEEFCHPLSDKRGMYLDELTIKQQKVVRWMNEDMIKNKKNKRLQQTAVNIYDQQTSTIEDALDNSIKAGVSRETGKDPFK